MGGGSTSVVSGVVCRTSTSLRHKTVLCDALQEALRGRVPFSAAAAEEADLTVTDKTPWAYLESEFHYAAHRQLCAEGASVAAIAGPSTLGTRFPLVLLLVEAQDAEDVSSLVKPIAQQLQAPSSRFERSRVVVLVLGKKSPSLKLGCPASFGDCLVEHGIGVVELRDTQHAAEYIVQCAAAISESRKRRTPSRFKVAGARCQTLPGGDKLRVAWVSQLMQVPGVSEEIAKVIAERYPSPAALLQAVSQADPSGSELGGPPGGVADSFLAELEYPIRGKKSMRRVGPVLSRRIFALFSPAVSAQHMLV